MARQYPSFVPGWTNSDKFDTSSGRIDRMNTLEEINSLEEQIQQLITRKNELIDRACVEGRDIALAHISSDVVSGFVPVDHLKVDKDTVVVYQGVPGAYSHQAMHDYFGKDIKNVNVAKFEDVIETVKSGKADYGVLPIENSSAGFVSGIYDMVGSSDLTIVGGDEVKVAHMLMGVPGSKLSDIQTVYSHPQGLLQCSEFLNRAGYAQCPVANTAVGAVKVRDEGDITQAAIASALAADIYGLEILKDDIVNNENNTTRFIILSKKKEYVKSAGNISVCFALPHESGTLYSILGHIKHNGLNMTSIESRPLRGRKWEYSFFITLEGSLMDPATIDALDHINKDSMDFKIIGTY